MVDEELSADDELLGAAELETLVDDELDGAADEDELLEESAADELDESRVDDELDESTADDELLEEPAELDESPVDDDEGTGGAVYVNVPEPSALGVKVQFAGIGDGTGSAPTRAAIVFRNVTVSEAAS
jgi:hypothetical protein